MARLRFVRTILIAALVSQAACSHRGLLVERHDAADVSVRRLPPGTVLRGAQRFIVYGDTQTGWRLVEAKRRFSLSNPRMLAVPFYQLWLAGYAAVGAVNWWRSSPDYGERERLMVRDAVWRAAVRERVAFVLNTGDIVADDGRRPGHWEVFLEENVWDHPLAATVPYVATPGNHERARDERWGRPNWDAVFGQRRFFRIVFDDAVLFVVDSNVIVDQKDEIPDDRQRALFEQWFVAPDGGEPAWLERMLASSDKRFRMVAMHHPPVTFSKHYRDWYRGGTDGERARRRLALLDLFGREGVDIVFSGHDHLYQHNVIRHATGGETHFLVGGGGGTPLRPAVDAETEFAIIEEFAAAGLDLVFVRNESIFQYEIVEVGPGGLVVRTIEATGEECGPGRVAETIRIPSAPGNGR